MSITIDTTDEGLEHVARPLLPWRRERMTECGLPEVVGRVIISRDAFDAKVKRQGKQRSAMTTCMTCWETASRWQDWAHSPSHVMRRELQRLSFRVNDSRLNDELRAIASLIEAHREEFDAFMDGLDQTCDLDTLRKARRRRVIQDRRWTL